MGFQLIPEMSPSQRIFAEGLFLAGFLDEQRISTVPEFTQALSSDQTAIRAKLNSASSAAEPPAMPDFRHLDEPEAIEIVESLAQQVGISHLASLTGFEWVEIAPLVPGRYLAGPLPIPGRYPTDATQLRTLAEFCMFGNAIHPSDFNLNFPGSGFLLESPEKVIPRAVLRSDLMSQAGIIVEYLFQRQPSPIAIMTLQDRAIVLRHQERLIPLLQAGVKYALCLTYYGYGVEVLRLLPSISQELLTSERPPQMIDFLNDNVIVRMTMRAPRRIITTFPQVLDV